VLDAYYYHQDTTADTINDFYITNEPENYKSMRTVCIKLRNLQTWNIVNRKNRNTGSRIQAY
jgi:hypothetical protein